MRKILINQLLFASLFTSVIFAQVSSSKNNLDLQSITSYPSIGVTIGGEFLITGSFPSYPGERLDQFLTRLIVESKNNIKLPANNDKIFLKVLEESNNYALRDIKLKRRDGSQIKIDLLKFRLSGDFNFNPYLQNDDVIIFPRFDMEYNFVEINGAVNKPTKFQFVDGDKLSDAIFFARGLNKAYENVSKAIISRLSYDGKAEKNIEVSINDDFPLQRGDRIKIVADQTNRKSYKVLVLGEVNNPGDIYITKSNTTLSEVINKAGGFTENASLKDAQLIRNLNSEQILLKRAIEQKDVFESLEQQDDEKNNYWRTLEKLRMTRTADLLLEDTVYFKIDNALRILESNNINNFVGIDSGNALLTNYLVKDGDIIIVPEKFEAVYVFGQVGRVGYYKYVSGLDHGYYIDQAGGLSEAADESAIYIIKGSSREWISVDEDGYTLEPGDFIYVAKVIKRTIWYHIYNVGVIAGIIGSIATLVLIFAK